MGLYDFEFLKDIKFYFNGIELLDPFKTLQGLPPKSAIEEPEPKADNADDERI